MRFPTIGLVLIGAVAGACASVTRSDPALTDQATVTVDNQSYYDMNVYASRGQRIRLGTARGLSKTVFTIPSTLVNGATTLRFIADPIGSSRASVSEEISVSPGDSIGLLIPPP